MSMYSTFPFPLEKKVHTESVQHTRTKRCTAPHRHVTREHIHTYIHTHTYTYTYTYIHTGGSVGKNGATGWLAQWRTLQKRVDWSEGKDSFKNVKDWGGEIDKHAEGGLVHEKKRQPRKYEDTTSSLPERNTSSGNRGLTGFLASLI